MLLLLFWSWMIERSRVKMTMFAFIGFAATAAVYVTAILTPSIERMRKAGMTHTPDFRRLHGLSMSAYLAETLLILAAGIALAQIRTPQKSCDSATR